VRRCRELQFAAEDLVREVEVLRGLGAGRLLVSCGTFPAELSGSLAVGRLMVRHPALSCGVRVGEWSETTTPVLNHEADLALAEMTVADSDARLVAERIGTHPCVFFCRAGHPLARVRSPTIRQLVAYPWALPTLPPRLFSMLGGMPCAAGRLDETGERFVPSIHMQTLSGSKQVVLASDAICGAPPVLIEDDLRAGRLSAIRFAAPWLRLDYGFIYLRDRTLSPAARAFMSEVRKIESELTRRTARIDLGFDFMGEQGRGGKT